MASGFGARIDEITETYEREPAPENFRIAVGEVPEGTQAVLRFEITGWGAGHPASSSNT